MSTLTREMRGSYAFIERNWFLVKRVGLVGRLVAQQPAQVDEVLLGAGALLGRAFGPLGGELGGRHLG